MKCLRILLLAAVVIMLTNSCYFKIKVSDESKDSDRQNVVYQQESEMEFDRDIEQIINAGLVDITIYQSDSLNRYELEVVPQLAGKVSVDFKDGVLEIKDGVLKYDNSGNMSKNGYTRIKVWTRNLKNIVSAGAGDINFPEEFHCENLNINIAGAGDVDINDIQASGKINLVIAGAGDAEIAGKASSFSYHIAGIGKIDIRNLECKEVSGEKAGLGKIYR